MSIEVTGDSLGSTIGTYYISEEKSLLAPDRPTYKLDDMNRYIYYWPSLMGWRIGNLGHMNSEEIEFAFYRGYIFFTLIEDICYVHILVCISRYSFRSSKCSHI